ncbi:MAG: hypothetical protein ACRCZ2_14145 [Fusobacteriaceae bacterium]
MTDKQLSDLLVKGCNQVFGLVYGLGIGALYLGGLSLFPLIYFWFFYQY